MAMTMKMDKTGRAHPCARKIKVFEIVPKILFGPRTFNCAKAFRTQRTILATSEPLMRDTAGVRRWWCLEFNLFCEASGKYGPL